jgi:hypothetical protein
LVHELTTLGYSQAGSCLAHVINLATQMLISTYSKSPHFDPKQPDAHVPTYRDEVGLVRAIVVKVCISTSPEKNMVAHPLPGTLIVKAKGNVENASDQGGQRASTSTYTRYEGAMVINIFDA